MDEETIKIIIQVIGFGVIPIVVLYLLIKFHNIKSQLDEINQFLVSDQWLRFAGYLWGFNVFFVTALFTAFNAFDQNDLIPLLMFMVIPLLLIFIYSSRTMILVDGKKIILHQFLKKKATYVIDQIKYVRQIKYDRYLIKFDDAKIVRISKYLTNAPCLYEMLSYYSRKRMARLLKERGYSETVKIIESEDSFDDYGEKMIIEVKGYNINCSVDHDDPGFPSQDEYVGVLFLSENGQITKKSIGQLTTEIGVWPLEYMSSKYKYKTTGVVGKVVDIIDENIIVIDVGFHIIADPVLTYWRTFSIKKLEIRDWKQDEIVKLVGDFQLEIIVND